MNMQQKEIRILIAEDDFLVREMIQELLENMGYTIIGKALDGGQAVEMAQLLRPDLVLMDIEMPKIDGIEATQRIYADNPVPVVVLTAYETPELVERASTAGVGAYLAKPPKARDLERAITIAMARFADMVELRRLNAELQARNEELQGALAKVKMLSGLLPICASCKKIRDDRGYWQQVEVYIRDHSEVEFSHGLCPDCARELFPDFYTEDE
jgi:AmiR/NasT family two-component response regulator